VAMDNPSEEIKWAYQSAMQGVIAERSYILAHALRDERAGRLKAEWLNEHEEYVSTGFISHCSDCGMRSNWTPQHIWTFIDWQSLAHRQLMGEE